MDWLSQVWPYLTPERQFHCCKYSLDGRVMGYPIHSLKEYEIAAIVGWDGE